jgi:streptomycin 6-kinase
LTATLHLDRERTVAWGYAQAVLSAIWNVEDGYEVEPTNAALRCAAAIRPFLGRETGARSDP